MSVSALPQRKFALVLNGTVPASVSAVKRADRPGGNSVVTVWQTWSPCVSVRGEGVSCLMTVVMPNRKRPLHSSNENLVWHPRRHSWKGCKAFEHSEITFPRGSSVLFFQCINIIYSLPLLFHVIAHVHYALLLLWSFKLLMRSQWIPQVQYSLWPPLDVINMV